MNHADTYCDICGLLKTDTQKLTFNQLKDLDVCQSDWNLYVQPFLDGAGPPYTATQAMFVQKGWK